MDRIWSAGHKRNSFRLFSGNEQGSGDLWAAKRLLLSRNVLERAVRVKNMLFVVHGSYTLYKYGGREAFACFYMVL